MRHTHLPALATDESTKTSGANLSILEVSIKMPHEFNGWIVVRLILLLAICKLLKQAITECKTYPWAVLLKLWIPKKNYTQKRLILVILERVTLQTELRFGLYFTMPPKKLSLNQIAIKACNQRILKLVCCFLIVSIFLMYDLFRNQLHLFCMD